MIFQLVLQEYNDVYLFCFVLFCLFVDMKQIFLSHLNWTTLRLNLVNLNVISHNFMLIKKREYEYNK